MKRKIPSDMTIERAGECRNFLLDSIGKKGEQTIDLSGVTAMDLSGVQLLIACLRQAAVSAREVHFTGALAPEVQHTVAIAGLREDGCSTGEALESAIRESL